MSSPAFELLLDMEENQNAFFSKDFKNWVNQPWEGGATRAKCGATHGAIFEAQTYTMQSQAMRKLDLHCLVLDTSEVASALTVHYCNEA